MDGPGSLECGVGVDTLDREMWEAVWLGWLETGGAGDPAHDLDHIRRVVANACAIGSAEGANLDILLPSAWLHDCVFVAKDSPHRRIASRLAADHAVSLLEKARYPQIHLQPIHHAITAHSFSAGIPPESLEAKVLQDADRLDALGAVGLSRCLMLGGHMGQPLTSPDDPFCRSRPPDDSRFVVDHFFAKLLKLGATMQTGTGREIAVRRTAFLQSYLDELSAELVG
ncbi:MAG: HD domain-containing protein [Verrucomicrobiota bacterium]